MQAQYRALHYSASRGKNWSRIAIEMRLLSQLLATKRSDFVETKTFCSALKKTAINVAIKSSQRSRSGLMDICRDIIACWVMSSRDDCRRKDKTPYDLILSRSCEHMKRNIKHQTLWKMTARQAERLKKEDLGDNCVRYVCARIFLAELQTVAKSAAT